MPEVLPHAPAAAVPKSAMWLLILIAMLDLFGFGLIIPLLPFYVPGYQENTIVQNFKVTLLFAVYSVCQFIGAPVLGVLSDRYGRRPVLAASQAGSAVGYLLLGLATLCKTPGQILAVVYLSRVIDGFSGGNISTVQAYIADSTAPKERAKWMGMLGAAFGVGFVLGPTIGGLLGHRNPSIPAYLAAVVSAAAAVGSWVLLPESRPKGPADAEAWLHPRRFAPILRRPVLAQLLAISFFTMAAFVMMESTMAVFLNRIFGWDARHIGLFFGYLGVVIVLVQGGLVGRLTKKRGEWALSAAGPMLVAAGMACFTLAGLSRAGALGGTAGAAGGAAVAALVILLVGGVFNATGRSLQQPTLASLLSRHSGVGEQGAVFGLYHGLGSLARVIGPLVAAPAAAVASLHVTGQFLTAGVIAAAMSVWTARLGRRAGGGQSNRQEVDIPPTAGEPHGITAEPT